MGYLIKRSSRGFAVLGIIVALTILAALGVVLTLTVASNQKGTIATQYKNQGFYISQAAFEYSMRNLRALHNCSPTTRQLLGTDFGLTVSGKVYSSTSFGADDTIAGNSFSVAMPTTNSASPCIYVLAASGSGTMSLSGNTSFNSLCVVNINSSSSSALTMGNNNTMTVSTLNIVGGYSAPANAITGTINTGHAATADPFLALPMISYGTTCDYTNRAVSGTTTLNPGVYCGGLAISGNGTVTFNPGNYIIDGGVVSVTGSGTVNANGVTIFLNSKIQGTYPTISVAGTVGFNLSAPLSGTYTGIAIYQSRSAPGGTNSLNGTAGANIAGAIYLPNQELQLSGSTSSTAKCTLPVSNTLKITGPANLKCMVGDLGGLVQAGC